MRRRPKAHLPVSMIFWGRCLPPAIMAILVVYCLKDIQLWQYPHGLAEALALALALALVILLHCWKENALLSISAGTACYIILSRVVLSR
jgi:branched-subunit amino acid transport protein AzlD